MDLKLNERRTVFRGKRVEVERLTYEDEQGRQIVREIGRHPGAVVILPLVDGGERVVLIRQRRVATGGDIWELPAGTMEPPLPAIELAKRELVEEAGYEAGTIEPISTFWTAPGLWDELMHAFVATDLTHVGVALEPGEQIDVHVVDYAEAIDMIRRGEIVDGKSIATLLMHDRFGRG